MREKKQSLEFLPGNNCGGCGYAGCSGLAAAIVKGEAPVGWMSGRWSSGCSKDWCRSWDRKPDAQVHEGSICKMCRNL